MTAATIPDEFRDVSKPPSYVDRGGFPRADVDIWGINEKRRKLIALQNDYNYLMKRIEPKVSRLFSLPKPTTASASSTEPVTSSKLESSSSAATSVPKRVTPPSTVLSDAAIAGVSDMDSITEMRTAARVSPWTLKPFFKVRTVTTRSPANDCGLRCGDVVLRFGTMVAENYTADSLREIVMASIGRDIPVTVRRVPEGIAELQLTPRRWEGRGLLGCHLVPYSED